MSGCFYYVCLLHTVIVKIYLVISLYRSFDGSYFFIYFYNLAVLIKIQRSATKAVFMLHTAYHRYIVLIKHTVTADIIFYRCFLAVLIYRENACRFFFVRAIGVFDIVKTSVKICYIIAVGILRNQLAVNVNVMHR